MAMLKPPKLTYINTRILQFLLDGKYFSGAWLPHTSSSSQLKMFNFAANSIQLKIPQVPWTCLDFFSSYSFLLFSFV